MTRRETALLSHYQLRTPAVAILCKIAQCRGKTCDKPPRDRRAYYEQLSCIKIMVRRRVWRPTITKGVTSTPTNFSPPSGRVGRFYLFERNKPSLLKGIRRTRCFLFSKARQSSLLSLKLAGKRPSAY